MRIDHSPAVLNLALLSALACAGYGCAGEVVSLMNRDAKVRGVAFGDVGEAVVATWDDGYLQSKETTGQVIGPKPQRFTESYFPVASVLGTPLVMAAPSCGCVEIDTLAAAAPTTTRTTVIAPRPRSSAAAGNLPAAQPGVDDSR